MKTAKEWLEDLRQARQYSDMLKGYDMFGGELSGMAEAFVFNQVENMVMLNLEDDELKACKCFVYTDTKAQAAVEYGCTEKWYNVILERAYKQINAEFSNEHYRAKYFNFKGDIHDYD